MILHISAAEEGFNDRASLNQAIKDEITTNVFFGGGFVSNTSMKKQIEQFYPDLNVNYNRNTANFMIGANIQFSKMDHIAISWKYQPNFYKSRRISYYPCLININFVNLVYKRQIQTDLKYATFLGAGPGIVSSSTNPENHLRFDATKYNFNVFLQQAVDKKSTRVLFELGSIIYSGTFSYGYQPGQELSKKTIYEFYLNMLVYLNKY